MEDNKRDYISEIEGQIFSIKKNLQSHQNIQKLQQKFYFIINKNLGEFLLHQSLLQEGEDKDDQNENQQIENTQDNIGEINVTDDVISYSQKYEQQNNQLDKSIEKEENEDEDESEGESLKTLMKVNSKGSEESLKRQSDSKRYTTEILTLENGSKALIFPRLNKLFEGLYPDRTKLMAALIKGHQLIDSNARQQRKKKLITEKSWLDSNRLHAYLNQNSKINKSPFEISKIGTNISGQIHRIKYVGNGEVVAKSNDRSVEKYDFILDSEVKKTTFLKLFQQSELITEVKEDIIEYDFKNNLIQSYCIIVEQAKVTLHDLISQWNDKNLSNKLGYSPEILSYYFLCALQILQYFHSKGFYFGDIKPQQLLIFKNQQVKVGDLSACIKLQEGKDENEKIYTIRALTMSYAPEILLQAVMKAQNLSKKELFEAEKYLLIKTYEYCIENTKNLETQSSYSDLPTRMLEELQSNSIEATFAKFTDLFSSDNELIQNLVKQVQEKNKDQAVITFLKLYKQTNLIFNTLNNYSNIDKQENQKWFQTEKIKEFKTDANFKNNILQILDLGKDTKLLGGSTSNIKSKELKYWLGLIFANINRGSYILGNKGMEIINVRSAPDDLKNNFKEFEEYFKFMELTFTDGQVMRRIGETLMRVINQGGENKEIMKYFVRGILLHTIHLIQTDYNHDREYKEFQNFRPLALELGINDIYFKSTQICIELYNQEEYTPLALSEIKAIKVHKSHSKIDFFQDYKIFLIKLRIFPIIIRIRVDNLIIQLKLNSFSLLGKIIQLLFFDLIIRSDRIIINILLSLDRARMKDIYFYA